MKPASITAIVFFCLCLSISASGQILINQGGFPGIGTDLSMEVDTSAVNVAGLTAEGAEQTWNATQVLTRPVPFDFKYISRNGTPFGDKFPDARCAVLGSVEHIQLSPYLILSVPVDTVFQPYRYERINADSVVGIGMELSISIFNGAYRFQKPALLYALPLTRNQSWTYNAEIDTTIVVSLLPVPIQAAVVETANTVADAEGTLMVGAGSYPCLRLRSAWTRKFMLRTSASQQWSEITSWTDSRIIYRWISNGLGVLLEVKSRKNEVNPHFATAGQVTRFISAVSVSNVGFDPGCGPAAPAPAACELSQNSPNPFNPTTTVRYRLASAAAVDLSVFDLLGRRVATLESGFMTAGSHRAVWNGADRTGRRAASGVYFVRLESRPAGAPAVTLTRKMILAD
jgi:hypothetical protein